MGHLLELSAEMRDLVGMVLGDQMPVSGADLVRARPPIDPEEGVRIGRFCLGLRLRCPPPKAPARIQPDPREEPEEEAHDNEIVQPPHGGDEIRGEVHWTHNIQEGAKNE